jgi:peptidoglycan hydrolase CwlO-like protein
VQPSASARRAVTFGAIGFPRSTCRLLPIAVAALALSGLAVTAAPSSADLQSRVAAAASSEGALQAGIGADNAHVAGFQGRISDLQARLSALESSLAIERAQLHALQTGLRAARSRLVALQLQLADDRQVLADQLRAQYETPQPDIVNVILDAKGFADLLERVNNLRAIARGDARTTNFVAVEGRRTAGQAAHLAVLEARQQSLTQTVLVQRDEVAQARLAVVSQEMVYVRARNRKSAELSRLQAHSRALQQQLAAISAQAAGAQPTTGGTLSFGGAGSQLGSVGSFVPHGGSDGFFSAPGTNYSVGSEPEIAARLDRLGQALHLHLIGISGYRSPQHSIEVGGFADDPHTRGAASDTPGVEGVPESTLNQFGLTRPFGGAAEADHIQLLGSA